MCNHFYQKMITIRELWIWRDLYTLQLICTFNKYHMFYTYYIYDIISSYYFFEYDWIAWLWLLSICYVKHKIRATSKKRGFLVFIAGCCAPDHCTWRSTYWLSGARNTLRSVEPGCSIQPPCHMICWKQTDLRNLMTSRHGRLNSADDQDGFEVLHRLKVKLL